MKFWPEIRKKSVEEIEMIQLIPTGVFLSLLNDDFCLMRYDNVLPLLRAFYHRKWKSLHFTVFKIKPFLDIIPTRISLVCGIFCLDKQHGKNTTKKKQWTKQILNVENNSDRSHWKFETIERMGSFVYETTNKKKPNRHTKHDSAPQILLNGSLSLIFRPQPKNK